MRSVNLAVAAVLTLLSVQRPTAAWADNPMGYRLLSAQEAAGLPHNHGALGLDVERSQQITDDGLTFDLMRVKGVRTGSPGAQAGLKLGDQIIAADGRVFPTIASFAAYIGSVTPGSRVSLDYIPAGGGAQQAQRVAVVAGGPGSAAPANDAPSGMSTREKIAIGIGAAALLVCYERGCFHKSAPGAPVQQ